MKNLDAEKVDFYPLGEIKRMHDNAVKMDSLEWPDKALFAMKISGSIWKKESFNELIKYDAQKPDNYLDTYHCCEMENAPHGLWIYDRYLVSCLKHLYYVRIANYEGDDGTMETDIHQAEDEEVFQALSLPMKL